MSFARCFGNLAATGMIASLLLFSGSGFAAIPSVMPQGKDHGSTRPVAPPPPEPVMVAPAPAFEVDVLVQAASKPLAGQMVLATLAKKTVETQTTGNDGIAHFLFGKPGKYIFSVTGAAGMAHRRFTVKATTPHAPQTFTLKLKPQPPA